MKKLIERCSFCRVPLVKRVTHGADRAYCSPRCRGAMNMMRYLARKHKRLVSESSRKNGGVGMKTETKGKR